MKSVLAAACLLSILPFSHSAEKDDASILKDGSFDNIPDLSALLSKGWGSTIPPKGAKDGTAELDSQISSDGGKSLKLSSVKPIVVNVTTPRMASPANTALKLCGMMKLENVVAGEKGWYTARVCAMAYDKDGAPIKGSGKTLASAIGTKDWTRFEKNYVTPPGACKISIGFELKNCTGTVWFDGINVVKSKEMPSIVDILADLEANDSTPNVIPAPQKAVYKDKSLRLENMELRFGESCDNIVKEAITAFAKEKAINLEAGKTPGATLIAGAPTDNMIKPLLKTLELSDEPKALGEQGYLLFSGVQDGRPLILIVSEGNPGRFYALQTLRQLLTAEGGVAKVRECLVADKPAYEMRGVVFGGMDRWFKGPPVKDEKTGKRIWQGWNYRDRAVAMKMNFVWLAGPPTRDCYVTPIPDPFKIQLKAFIDDCRKIYVTPSIGLSPYRQNPRPGREKGGIVYSSDEDIAGAVENLVCLYGLGARHLFLAFDDLPPYRWLEYEQDKAKFKSIGEAHAFYVGAVYRKFKERCPDGILRIIGVAYGGAEDMPDSWKEYCRDVASLPKEIEFIWDSRSSADIAYASKLCGDRKIMVWSNYFASLYEKLSRVPAFSYPYAGDADLHNHTTGHFVLMCDMPNEDAAHVSWYTAADYMWNPQAYGMKDSFLRAVAKSTGGGVEWIKEYMGAIHAYQKNSGMPGDTGEERANAARKLKAKLDECLAHLKGSAGEGLWRSLEKENAGIESELDILLSQYKEKPLPIRVGKTERPPSIDGLLEGDACWSSAEKVTGFLVLGKNTTADVQTKVRLAYDKDNLYVLATMDEPFPEKLKAAFKGRDQEIFIDDCFEMFIGSRRNLEDYYHIAVNSLGTVYDQKRLAGDCRKWDGDYKIAVSKQKASWTVEMAMPWRNFGGLADEPELTCNFTRERYADGKSCQTYAPLFGSGFHLPQWFWLMKLEGK